MTKSPRQKVSIIKITFRTGSSLGPSAVKNRARQTQASLSDVARQCRPEGQLYRMPAAALIASPLLRSGGEAALVTGPYLIFILRLLPNLHRRQEAETPGSVFVFLCQFIFMLI